MSSNIKKKEKKSNFELLKILAMLMIISFHYVYKSGYEPEIMNLKTLCIKTFWLLGEWGVNLFILITGYFMIKKEMSIKKIILIIAEVFFYNLLNVFLSYYFLNISIEIRDIMFPVIYNRFWFISAYIIIYLLSPYINKFIISMNKKELEKFLVVVLFIWSFIPTIFGLRFNSSETLLYYSRLIWLIIMYFIGAYIKLYDIKLLNNPEKSLLTAISCFAVMVISIVFMYQCRDIFNMIGTTEYAYLWTPNNIFMLALSVSTFQFFAKLQIKPIKIINVLASTTLGIYMLHDGCFNIFLWRVLFNTKLKLESTNFIFYIFGTTIVIFVIGAIFDLIRKVFEKFTINKILELEHFKRIISRINSYVFSDKTIHEKQE